MVTSLTEPLHGIVCEERKRSGLRLTSYTLERFVPVMERVENFKLVFLLQIGKCSKHVGL